jgi:hypothetical protein
MKTEQIIIDFNDGDFDETLRPFFGNFINFLKYANKHDFIDELHLDNIPADEFKESLNYFDSIGKVANLDYNEVEENLKNGLLLYQLEKNPKETLEFIIDNLITDVYSMNGGYYLHIDDREELANLFESGGRDYGPYEYAKSVLGEDIWEPYSDTTSDIYGDVIDELNDKNKTILAEYIIRNIGDQEFSLEEYDNELFSEFSNEQGTEGSFQITNDNVMRLIDDKDAMTEMLNGELSDLDSELYNIHSNAYNSSYETEVYNDVWNELSTYFRPKSWETVEKTRRDGVKVYLEYLQINNFYNIVYDFLILNEGGSYNESFMEYFGNLIGIMSSLMEDGEYNWLSFRIPDYADWDLTKKYINEFLPDYI